MAKKKLPNQGYDGIYVRNRWLEEQKAILRAKGLEVSIVKEICSKKYSSVYEKIDELKNIYNQYGNLFDNNNITWLKEQLLMALTQEYETRICAEFSKRVDNAKLYYTIYDYKSSKYPGTYEEYAEAKAIDSLLEETSKHRYGGYMHVVIMNILTPEYRALRRHEIVEQRAAGAKHETVVQHEQENIQSMIERVRRNCDMDQKKDR